MLKTQRFLITSTHFSIICCVVTQLQGFCVGMQPHYRLPQASSDSEAPSHWSLKSTRGVYLQDGSWQALHFRP